MLEMKNSSPVDKHDLENSMSSILKIQRKASAVNKEETSL